MKRLRPRIGFAHVISVIVLFGALSGGYASAFSGSGTLQKGALKNIPVETSFPPPATAPTVRSLTGVGRIVAVCQDTNPDAAYAYFENTSGETLAIRGEGDGQIVLNGAIGSNQLFTDATGQFVGHISPVDGTKAPQVSLQISIRNTNDCTTSVVDVLALNTQQ